MIMGGSRYIITDQNQTYFITCTLIGWVDLFTRPEYKNIIVDSLNYCTYKKGLVLHAWVLMTNHLHFIGRCEEPFKMSDFLRDFKKFTSKQLAATIKEIPESRRDWLLDKFNFEARKTNRAENNKIWQDDNHPIDLHDIDPDQKLNYIHENPVKAGIVEFPEQYLYSSARDYIGIKGLVDIKII